MTTKKSQTKNLKKKMKREKCQKCRYYRKCPYIRMKKNRTLKNTNSTKVKTLCENEHDWRYVGKILECIKCGNLESSNKHIRVNRIK